MHTFLSCNDTEDKSNKADMNGVYRLKCLNEFRSLETQHAKGSGAIEFEVK